MLDFHVHLARLPRPERLSLELIEKGYRAVIVACEPWEWEKTERLLPIWKKSAIPCFGIHPMIAGVFDKKRLNELRELLKKHPGAFVGECGIDKRFPGYGPGEIQEEVFRFQARLSLELRRPLMIHVVGNHRRVLGILEDEGFSASAPQAIFHRFGGDRETINRAMLLNPIFSLHPDSFRKASTRDALSLIPQERIRFETDADENLFPATADFLVCQLKAVSEHFRHWNSCRFQGPISYF